MSLSRNPNPPVPPWFDEFHEDLRLPDGVELVSLLQSFDSYSNSNTPEVPVQSSGVFISEKSGWRLQCDVYGPEGEGAPTLVYLHGGAWILGSPWTHRRITAELASRGVLVLSLDYRRAPKFRYPAARDDVLTAISWARAEASTYGGDPARLFVGGDSAGANLAAGAIASGAAGPLAGAILLYGVYDYFRVKSRMIELFQAFCGDDQPYLPDQDLDALRLEPGVVPEMATRIFPRTLLMTGVRDLFLAEHLSMHSHLRCAGIDVQSELVPDAAHGFLLSPGHAQYAAALDRVAAFMLS